ncbi:pyridoxal phosphate-dependent transferase [Peziza echinospora]|nr:pyridoxal phosphate-dependent transferase [Peziza echinospora]
MQAEILEFMNKVKLDTKVLTYGDAAIGSTRLRTNLASFFNDYFHPFEQVKVEEIIVSTGVSSIVDQVAWATCNEGDGVLVSRPVYSGFAIDVSARSRAVLVPVSVGDIDPLSVDAIACYESQLLASAAAGTKIKALILANPHNPLGKCYSVESIKAHMRFCQKYNLHFISDEIYAMSVFDTPGSEFKESFYSALGIDINGIIDPDLVHVLYGMSKDFSANGLRLGALHTRNKALYSALSTISPCAWPSAPADQIWSSMLEDRVWLDTYFSHTRRRLSEAYTVLTTILDEHEIKYVKGGNAGFFLWCDFTFALKGDEKELSTLPEKIIADKKLNRRLMDGGVYLANSGAFHSEVPGWYRITFSHTTEMLALGLKRVLKVIKNVEFDNIDEIVKPLKESLDVTSNTRKTEDIIDTVEEGLRRM